jgi:hypothetical protein
VAPPGRTRIDVPGVSWGNLTALTPAQVMAALDGTVTRP